MKRDGLIRLQRTTRLFAGLHHRRKHRHIALRRNLWRSQKLTAAQRSAIATDAACRRWFGEYDRLPCPLCGSSATQMNGTRNGCQRGRCRTCKRTWYLPDKALEKAA